MKKPGSIFSLVILVVIIAVTIGTCSVHYARKADEAVTSLIDKLQGSVDSFPGKLN